MKLADGLTADLVLQNGSMHVLETVDVSGLNATPRRAVTDIAVSGLVLEQARINYGSGGTRTKLVYDASTSVENAARSCLDAVQHQGAELINWSSTSDRIKLITTITSLAVPRELKSDRARRFVSSEMPKLRLA